MGDQFPSFFYIFIEFNRLIDPSVYPLRCTHGTRRCSTRGRPKWMHLPRPSGWEKSRRPMVWCIRRWQNARFKKCWKLGGSTVLLAFSIWSDILSHSWYPMVIPCYPMVIFSGEKTIYPSYPILSHGLDGDPLFPWKSWGGFAARKIAWPQASVKEPRRKWGALVAGCFLIVCWPFDGSWYTLLLVKNGKPTTGLVCAGWLHFSPFWWMLFLFNNNQRKTNWKTDFSQIHIFPPWK